MKTTARRFWRTRPVSITARRRIAAVCVVTGFVLLAIETALHERSIVPYVAPFLAVVCGLDYLHLTRGRP